MDVLVALLCIVFLSVLIYGIVYGHNLTKEHGISCRTIYIPEDVSPKALREDLLSLDDNKNDSKVSDKLKKRARSLGISKTKVDTMKKSELIRLILMESVDPTRIILEGEDIEQSNINKIKTLKRIILSINSISEDNYKEAMENYIKYLYIQPPHKIEYPGKITFKDYIDRKDTKFSLEFKVIDSLFQKSRKRSLK